MKEIWKAFSLKCKEAWNKTVSAISVLFKDFVEEGKALLIQIIDLFKDLLGNLLKTGEVILMTLIVGILSALFEAIYDTIIYGLDKLKELLASAWKEKK